MDLFWKYLYSWRLILVCMLLGGLVLGGIQVFRSQKNAQQQVVTAEDAKAGLEDKISSLRSTLTDTENQTVDQMISLTETIDNQRRYKTESLYASMDPMHVNQIALIYYVDAHYKMNFAGENDTDPTAAIIHAYRSYITSAGIVSDIRRENRQDIPDNYVNELIMVEDDSTDMNPYSRNSTGFSVIIKSNDMGLSRALSEAVQTALQKRHDQVAAGIADHDLQLIGSDEALIVDRVMMNDQNTVNTAIYNSTYQLNYIRSLCSDDQKALYTAILQKRSISLNAGTEVKDKTQVDAVADVHNNSEISKRGIAKYILLGMMLGICFACGYITAVYFFDGKIKESREMTDQYGLRLIGECHIEVNAENPFAFVDRFLDQIRYKGRISIEQEKELALVNLRASCQKENTSHVLVTSSRTWNQNEKKMIREMAEKLEKEGIEIISNDNMIFNVQSFSKMSEIGNVVFVEKLGESRYEQFEKALIQCKEQKAKVVGVIIL